MKNNCIIFGDDFYNTYGILRSLGEVDIKPIYINVCQKESWVAKSNYYSEYHQVKSYEEGINYIIEKYSSNTNKPLINTTSDKGINCLDKYKHLLSDHFTFPHINSKYTIEQLLNKNTQCIIAQRAGFIIPGCISISPGQSVDDYMSIINYPCHLKPLDSLNGLKQDMIICYSFEELKYSLKTFSEKKISVIIQDYINKDYEIVLMGCVLKSGELIVPGTIIKTREWPFRGVTSTTIMKKNLLNVDFEKIKRFMSEIGYYGIFSLEFAIKDKHAFFIEANFRSDANNYTATAAGVNIPHLIYMDSMGLNTSEMPKSISHEVKSQVEFVDYDWMQHHILYFFKWLWDTFSANNYMIFNKKDKKPFEYITRKPFQYKCLNLLYKTLNLFKNI